MYSLEKQVLRGFLVKSRSCEVLKAGLAEIVPDLWRKFSNSSYIQSLYLYIALSNTHYSDDARSPAAQGGREVLRGGIIQTATTQSHFLRSVL